MTVIANGLALSWHIHAAGLIDLIQCGLVTPYGDIDLAQYWLT